MPEPVSLTVTMTRIRLNDCRERYPTAARRLAQRVGRQILQRLLQAHRIAGHDLRARRDVGRQRHAFLLGRSFVAGEHAAEDVLQRDVLRLERFAAALEPREIEQIADDALDALRLVTDDREVPLARLGIERLRVERQRLEIAAHGRQRRHQLV